MYIEGMSDTADIKETNLFLHFGPSYGPERNVNIVPSGDDYKVLKNTLKLF